MAENGPAPHPGPLPASGARGSPALHHGPCDKLRAGSLPANAGRGGSRRPSPASGRGGCYALAGFGGRPRLRGPGWRRTWPRPIAFANSDRLAAYSGATMG
jgi:hypothetical protein